MGYKDTLWDNISQLFPVKEFCDLEISTPDHSFHCHKLVLAAASLPFHDIIKESLVDEQHGIMKLDMAFMSSEVVESLLKYLYTGEEPSSEFEAIAEHELAVSLFTQSYCVNDTLKEIKSLYLDAIEKKESVNVLVVDDHHDDIDQHVENNENDSLCIIRITGDKDKLTQRAEYTRLKVRLPREPPFLCPCENCGKIFESHERLRSHYRHNHGEKRYKCNLCPLRFLYPRDLRCHQRTHTGEKPFICEQCGKRFSQMSAVTTHMKTHAKGKSTNSEDVLIHPCIVCKRQYVRKEKKPKFDHKNYDMSSLVCPNVNCAKKFASVNSLRKHIYNDICNMRQLSCSECKTEFATMQLLRQHIVEKHCKHTYKTKKKKAKEDGDTIVSNIEEQQDPDTLHEEFSEVQEAIVQLQSDNDFLLEPVSTENITDVSILADFGENVELGSEIVMELEEV